MVLTIARRRFLTGLAVTAAVPSVARAQQPKPIVGFVNVESAGSGYGRMAGLFRDGLRETGYVDGQNVSIEEHWADGHSDRLPAFMADLVQRRVTVIAATTTPAALAAKASVATIPVVFEMGGDPVALGLVGSVNHPGGNITGVSQTNRDVSPKRLELLHEVLPQVKVITWLVNPENAELVADNPISAAAGSLGVELRQAQASSVKELDQVFAIAAQVHGGAFIINDDPFLTSQSERIGTLAAQYGIPAIYKGREFVIAGGLMSYGTVIGDSYNLAGVYVGRILKGDKPGDLPVQRASRVQLFINLKSAKALGISIPLPVSGRADEVIE